MIQFSSKNKRFDWYWMGQYYHVKKCKDIFEKFIVMLKINLFHIQSHTCGPSCIQLINIKSLLTIFKIKQTKIKKKLNFL